MRFSALFGGVFGQTALSSLQLLKGNFSGASWPGLVTSLLKVTEKMQETELTLYVHIRDKNFKRFADVIA